MIILIPIMLVYGLFSVSGLILVWTEDRTLKKSTPPTGVSVIMAVRNEIKSIAKLIDQILKNKTNFEVEVIVVDDGSDDGTLEYLKKLSNPKVVVLQNKEEGKKAAIKLALENAKHEIIIQTDGDCEVGEYWLLSMVNRLLSDKTRIVIGPVYPIASKSILNALIRLEWLGIQFLTAYTARLKQPALSNGANMAFYKKDYRDFIASKLGDKYASGDDVFFLKYISKLGKAVFNLDKASIVLTQMPQTLGALVKQRVRWITKANKSSNFLSTLFSTIVAMANFVWIAGVYFVIQDYHALPILMITVGWKLISDFIICWNMGRFYNDLRLLSWVPVMFFVFPVYLILGLFFSFRRSYSWKGRKVK
jgi:glycosyltransferase involved in cell wall biosynthesis